jgi:single-strand DNA-binding protein
MLNYLALTGKLEHDPEMYYLGANHDQPEASFNLVFLSGINRTGRIKVTCFNRLAYLVARYLHQGVQVTVAGVLDQQQGESADKQGNYEFRLIARSLEILGTDGCSNTRQTQLESRLPGHQTCADIPQENLAKGSD